MIKYLLLVYACLYASTSFAQTIKVAVLDTGLNGGYTGHHLCGKGHYDFVAHEPGVGFDSIDHGTKVVNIIEGAQTKRFGYCLLIYKVGEVRPEPRYVARALVYAKKQGAVLYNISYTAYKGPVYEQSFIRNNPKLYFIVAAGNQAKQIRCERSCSLLKNLILVGALDPSTGQPAWYSNWGSAVKVMKPAVNGTDYAAASATGDVIKCALELK